MILQITTSDALLHTDMMPKFYGTFGLIFPFHHAVEGLRFLEFNGPCCSRIGFNVLALSVYLLSFSGFLFILSKLKISRVLREAQKGTIQDAVGTTTIALPSSVSYATGV